MASREILNWGYMHVCYEGHLLVKYAGRVINKMNFQVLLLSSSIISVNITVTYIFSINKCGCK